MLIFVEFTVLVSFTRDPSPLYRQLAIVPRRGGCIRRATELVLIPRLLRPGIVDKRCSLISLRLTPTFPMLSLRRSCVLNPLAVTNAVAVEGN